MPAGGRGYTRPPSLISVWSTAPFLLNNSVGKFDPSPSVAARMGSFQDSIEKMLWPEKRDKDPVLGDKVPRGRPDRPHDRPAISESQADICPTSSSLCWVSDNASSPGSSAKVVW